MARFLFLLLLVTVSALVCATGTAAPENVDQYLYSVPHEASGQGETDKVTIIEYVAPMDRREMTDIPADPTDNSVYEERPDFLYAPDYPHYRVVTFYLQWCNACKQFQPKFWRIAERIHEFVPGHTVEFFAVSCSPNRMICTEHEARIFPSVLMIRPKEIGIDGRFLFREHITTMAVLQKLGLEDELSTTSNMRKTVLWDEDPIQFGDEKVKVAFVPKKYTTPQEEISVVSAFLLPLSFLLVFISGSLLGHGKARRLVVKAG